ncbi:MAG: alkaline phosphatase D family protein [Frankia sp.]
MPRLVLGPMLRYVDATRATVWVETDRPCDVQVEVAGARAGQVLRPATRTFAVAGHHYGLVVVDGLAPGGAAPYTVSLDGTSVWPGDGPPSVIATPLAGTRKARIAFGSCRVAAPLEDERHGVDALHALALRLRAQPREQWPDLLLLVGDQVYADLPSGEVEVEVVSFEEYAQLYRRSWSPPEVRWLLSTLPTAMIFDDHDVRDDWNTSAAWRREARAQPDWQKKITSALTAYWLYQHLGNLDPDQLATLPVLAEVRAAGDGEHALRRFAAEADAQADIEAVINTSDGEWAPRWSYQRDLGGSRLVVVDSRCGRVLRGERAMVGAREWAWVRRQSAGSFDHLLIATSLPYLLPPGVHHVEAWSEPVCAGRWGPRAAKFGERLRRKVDLEHWASFGRSFSDMADLVTEVGASVHGPAPATIGLLSGDVHFSYLARVRGGRPAMTSTVYQAVCSPLRNPLEGRLRRMSAVSSWWGPAAVAALLPRLVGRRPPKLRWAIQGGLSFANTVALLDLDGRQAQLAWWEASRPDRLSLAATHHLTE